MIRQNKFIIFFLLSTILLIQAEEWKFQYEKDKIKVYTKKTGNSTFDEYMGIGVVDADIWTIVALMDDLDSYPKWNGNCIHAEIIVPRKDDTVFY